MFEDGPPSGLLRRLGLFRSGQSIVARARIVAFVAWAPLLLLAGLQSLITGGADLVSLAGSVGLHARYLVAAPLLVLADATCGAQLGAIVKQFARGGLVREPDHAALEGAMATARRRLRHPAARITVVTIAFASAFAVIGGHAADAVPAWARPGGTTPLYSPAGWWHMLVSLPLLLALTLGWLWRLGVWALLLRRLSRLDLRLVPPHPDRAAGIAFLGQSVRAWGVVAFAIAAICAGRSAQIVLAGSGLPTAQFTFNIIVLLTLAALFVAPLFVFTPTRSTP
jgi:hypothetical protein